MIVAPGRKTLTCLLLAVCVGFLSGCEDDGGSSFDFGDNDPAVWVAMGDSITQGLSDNAPSYPSRLGTMTGKTVHNLGNGGEHAYEGASRIRGVLSGYKPGRILLLYGINDIFHKQSTDAIRDDLRFMVQTAKANKTQVRVATLIPCPGHDGKFQGKVDRLNGKIRQMAAEEDVKVIDLAAKFGTGDGLMRRDGVHPNSDGNNLIARAFRK